MSWPAFRSLQPDRLLAIVPLGALEAHGPHLPLGTDIVIAEAMAAAGADRLSARGFDVVVLPALPVSPAPFAAGFAGTVDAPPEATVASLVSIARSAARHGAMATVVANAHHDPAHVGAIREAVKAVAADGSAAIIFPDLTRRRWADRLTEEFRSGACHAGRYEGSVVLAAAPQLVDADLAAALPANPRSLVDAIRSGHRTFAEAGGPDAYFGAPADATAAEGREIIDRLGAVVEEAVLEALAERTIAHSGTTADMMHDKAATRDAALAIVNPRDLGRPHGFSHGVSSPAGWRTLYVAGQTAVDEPGAAASGDLVAQFAAALARVLAVVRAAGGEATNVARMTVYVTDLDAYRDGRGRLADVWREQMGRHYPAMALVEVSRLVDPGAVVEIEADAALPPARRDAWPAPSS